MSEWVMCWSGTGGDEQWAVGSGQWYGALLIVACENFGGVSWRYGDRLGGGRVTRDMRDASWRRAVRHLILGSGDVIGWLRFGAWLVLGWKPSRDLVYGVIDTCASYPNPWGWGCAGAQRFEKIMAVSS